jgi:hypothetical protein
MIIGKIMALCGVFALKPSRWRLAIARGSVRQNFGQQKTPRSFRSAAFL